MKIELTLIIIALLIITLLVGINLVVIVISLQEKIEKARLELKDSIRAYLDVVPLFLFNIGENNSEIYKMREKWFSDWNNPEKHWSIWTGIDHKIDNRIEKDPTNNAIDRITEKEVLVRTSTHEYNSRVLKYTNKLEKSIYKFAKLFDFKYGSKNYQLLEDF